MSIKNIVLVLLTLVYCQPAIAGYVWFIDTTGKAVKVDLEKNRVTGKAQLNPSEKPTIGGPKRSVVTSDKYVFIVSNLDRGRTINAYTKWDLKKVRERLVVSTDDIQEYPLMVPLKDRLLLTWGAATKDDDLLKGGYVKYDSMSTVVPVNHVIELSKMVCVTNGATSILDVEVDNQKRTVDHFDINLKTIGSTLIPEIWLSKNSNKAIEHCRDNMLLLVELIKDTRETFYYPFDVSSNAALNKIQVKDQGIGFLLPENRILIAGTKKNKGNLNAYDVSSGKKIAHKDLRDTFGSVVYLEGIITSDGRKLFAVGTKKNSGTPVVISVDLTTFQETIVLEGFEPSFFAYSGTDKS